MSYHCKRYGMDRGARAAVTTALRSRLDMGSQMSHSHSV
jgi:hypothetical protein